MSTYVTSTHWVRRAGDFRVLTGKRDRLGYALTPEERERLDELQRVFSQDANRRRLPWTHREQIRVPLSVVVEWEDGRGMARDISGEGIFVATAAPLPVGTHVVLRMSEEPDVTEGGDDDLPDDRQAWQFAAEVVRAESDGMGLRFVGIPLCMRITHARPAEDGATALPGSDPQHAGA